MYRVDNNGKLVREMREIKASQNEVLGVIEKYFDQKPEKKKENFWERDVFHSREERKERENSKHRDV